MPADRRSLRDLYRLFAAIRTPREAGLLLKDILTPRELRSVAERWRLVRALASGMRQRDIKEEHGISISKITRGSRALRYGSGGFRLFLKRLGHRSR